MAPQPPKLDEIRSARAALGAQVRHTPTWRWQSLAVEDHLGPNTQVFAKLELLQFTGSFKPRGAVLGVRQLDEAGRERGITAVSAGNHAMAVGYAAAAVGTHAKVVMPNNANPARIAGCKAYGAQVVLVDDVHAAFTEATRLQEEEGRTLIHPFDGPTVALGTATLGLELATDAGQLDAVIVPIGGGGLCAGVATALKAVQPNCRIYGVEPTGADSMHRSFAAGRPMSIDRVNTIADSLGAPYAAEYSFGLCQAFVDELVLIDDNQLRDAMGLLFQDLKLAVEPAGAAATAALWGPLRERVRGQRVGVIVCGSNIDVPSFWTLVQSRHPRDGTAPA